MQKFYRIAVLFSIVLIPQFIFSQDINQAFETWPPTDWTTFLNNNSETEAPWESNAFGRSGNGAATNSGQESGGGDGAEEWLVTPLLKPSSAKKLLQFYEEVTFTSTNLEALLSVRVSTSSQTDVSTFSKIVEYSSITTATSFAQRQVDLTDYIDTPIFIAFVAKENGSNPSHWMTGWAIDDVTGIDLFFPSIDAKASNFSSASSCSLSSSENLTLTIENNGSTTITSCPVEYRINGGTWISAGTFTGSITAGNSANYIFNLDLSSYTSCSIEARTVLASDEFSLNDYSSSINLGSYEVNANASYSTSFEPNEINDWLTFDVNGNGNSGEGEWTHTSGNSCNGTHHFIYEDDPSTAANDWIISPCIYLTNGDRYEVSFSYKVGDFGTENMRVAIGNGQAPGNMTLQTWNNTGLNNTTCNTFTQEYVANYTGFHYVGIQAYSDAFEDILVVDNFSVSYLPSTDASAINLTSSAISSCDVGNTTFTATIFNDGLNSITSCPIEYQIDNDGWVSAGTYSGTIAAGNSDTYNFDINLSLEANYTISVRTQLTGDEDASDDTYSGNVTVTHMAPHDLYVSDLTNGGESGDNQLGWNALDINGDGNGSTGEWILGATQKCNGTNGFTYTANGNTANDWLFSPCVEMEAGETYRITLNYKTGGTGGGILGNNKTEKMSVAVFNSQNVGDVVSVLDNETGLTGGCAAYSGDYIATASGVYNFGVKCYSAANQTYLSLDDINISLLPPPQARNVGVTKVAVNNYDCGLSNSEDVTITIENFGANTVTTTDIEYQLNGGSWTSAGTYSGSIIYGKTDTYTFNLDLSGAAGQTINVRTNGVNGNSDGDTSNDTFTGYTILDYQAHDFDNGAFSMDFESGDSFQNWHIQDVNGDGDEANGQWTYNTDGYDCNGTGYAIYSYSDQTANDWLITPCLYFRAGINYNLTFEYKADNPGFTNNTEKLLVALGSTSSSVGMTTTLEDIGTFTNGVGCRNADITFTAPSDGVYYIGFKAYSDANEVFLIVDNINIEKEITPNTYYSVANGLETDAIWSITRNGSAQNAVFNNLTNIIVQDGHSVTVNDNITANNIVIENGGTLQSDNSNRTISISGDFTTSGTFSPSNSTVVFEGAVSQNINGGAKFYNLTLNNSLGLNLINGTDSITGTLTVTNGTLTTNNNLRIMSDASGTGRVANLSTGSISGNVTVERYIPAGATNYRMLSSPVQNATYEDWDDDFITSGIPGSDYPNWPSAANRFESIKYYDETQSGATNIGYSAPSNTLNTIDVGRGHFVWCGDNMNSTNAFDITVSGPLNVGNINIPINYTNTGNSNSDGWNLIGNPYASEIDFTGIYNNASNIDNIFYIYNPQSGNMDLWNEVANDNLYDLSGNIASGQALWVKATDGTDLLVQETDKTNSAVGLFENPMKSAVTELVIDVTSSLNLFYDRVKLKWNDDAEFGRDDYDAIKFNGGNYYAPKMALVVDSALWAINALPAPKMPVQIPIRVWANTSATYTLDFAPEIDFLNQTCLEVYDKETGNTYPLENGLEISIDIEASVPTERLVLQIAGTVSYSSGNISCNGNNDGFASVLPPTQDQWLVVWKDLDGNVLKQEATTGVSNISNLSAGEYLIEMTNGNWGKKVAQFEITEPDALNLVVNTEDESCFGYNNGKIAVTMFGGTGNINWYINNELQTENETNNVAPGLYNIKLKDEKNCTVEQNDLVIKPGRQIIFAIEPSTNYVDLNNNEPVNFEYSGQNADNIYWEFGDGGIGSGAFTSHLYTDEGEFDVICKVTIDNCTAEHTPVTIIVERNTSVKETINNESVLVKNTKEEIIITTENSVNRFEVLSVDGKTVLNANNSNNEVVIQKQKLPAGIYMVNLYTIDNLLTTKIAIE